jgi:hypothetical protein
MEETLRSTVGRAADVPRKVRESMGENRRLGGWTAGRLNASA